MTPVPPEARPQPGEDSSAEEPGGQGYQAHFYDNVVPAFVEHELERLYQNIMTTVARFDIFNAAPAASTYVERADGRITTVFLFRREQRCVNVYNEQVTLDPDAVGRFARAVFARYPAVRRISFYAIATDTGAIGYPLQAHECLEDIILPLPATADAYQDALGKNTRAAIRRYYSKLRRDFPSFRFDVKAGAAVDEQQIRQVIVFNRARMNAKNQVSYHTERGTEQLMRLVRKYGLVGVATIESQVCAGIICFLIGNSCQMAVVAHDPTYDDYRLGKLCCYLSICDAIERGASEYHFGWGRFDYKFKMRGQLKPLYRVAVYRSRLSIVRDARYVSGMAAAAGVRRLRLRLAQAEAGSSAGDRWLTALAGAARVAKHRLRSGAKAQPLPKPGPPDDK
jgi:hypothetical protein